MSARRCPRCRANLNAHANMTDEAPPEVGDVTVCAYCLHVLLFAEEGGLREPTKPELEQLMQDENLRRTINVAAAMRGTLR